MILKEITLNNFKNIAAANLRLSPGINCFLGDNGMGKSNLLDAIYFLSFCKSFTGAPDSLLIARGEEFAMIQARYLRREANEELSVALRAGRAKSFKRSGKEYRRLSEHIGKFPLVLVSPADMDLVAGPPEERRRFLDILISQTDARYLDALIRYNNALEQRNRLLRDGVDDINLYLAIEMMMEASARIIADARRENLDRLIDVFKTYYAAISGDSELPRLRYISHLADPSVRLTDIFAERRARDAALRFTSAGPHRDDIEMLLDDLPVRRAASQGQQKTFTIALRLAQYDFLHRVSGIAPLLLLDDIFDKLDAGRVSRIMQVASHPSFGQIFITDTNRKHLDEVINTAAETDYALWTVHDGSFSMI